MLAQNVQQSLQIDTDVTPQTISNEFAMQYGPLIEDAHVVVMEEAKLPDGSPVPASPGTPRKGRRRSLTAVSHLTGPASAKILGLGRMDSPLTPTAGLPNPTTSPLSKQFIEEEVPLSGRGRDMLHLVEFRAGRRDYFYLPVNSFVYKIFTDDVKASLIFKLRTNLGRCKLRSCSW
jgi:hypothetical protein